MYCCDRHYTVLGIVQFASSLVLSKPQSVTNGVRTSVGRIGPMQAKGFGRPRAGVPDLGSAPRASRSERT